jgi:hypothetical protein
MPDFWLMALVAVPVLGMAVVLWDAVIRHPKLLRRTIEDLGGEYLEAEWRPFRGSGLSMAYDVRCRFAGSERTMRCLVRFSEVLVASDALPLGTFGASGTSASDGSVTVGAPASGGSGRPGTAATPGAPPYRLRWFLAGCVLPLLVVAGVLLAFRLSAPVRPVPPPPAAAGLRPWGVVDIEMTPSATASGVERSLVESIRSETALAFDPDRDGDRDYDLLALSGGGSHGAFGAGVLCGWTERGNRPDFKVVTGISTGSLQATFAFLGPAYDSHLREFYTRTRTEDVYRKRSPLETVFQESVFDTAPLRERIEAVIDAPLLEAVAAKHRRGHRLFVGTFNMDANEFVIWDMGAIAASGHPRTRERYMDILLASCSIPVLFPPVYFDVESESAHYQEMHADGSAESAAFLRGFMLDLEDAFGRAGVVPGGIQTRLYIIRNGRSSDQAATAAVRPNSLAIASATIEKLFKLSASSSLYRMYVLANRYGIEFNLRSIPDSHPLDFAPYLFDTPKMVRLFETGFSLARSSDTWASTPPGLDPDEVSPPPKPPASPSSATPLGTD